MLSFPSLRFAIAAAFAVGCLLNAGAVRAQQPSTGAVNTALEILEMKRAFELFDPISAGVVEKTRRDFIQLNFSLAKDLDETAAALRQQYAPRTAMLKNDLAALYAARFTEQELKDLLTFYKTPLGKKAILEDAAFIERALDTAQEWASKLQEEVTRQFRAEMKKKGHNL